MLPAGYHFVGWIDPDSRACRCIREADGITVMLELPKGAATDQEVARLRAEHALLAELDMPGIVRPLAFAGDEGAVALVLGDPGGQTLSDMLAEGPLALDGTLAIAASVAATLAALHRRRVVHRNIHPDSILVVAAPQTCLAGFGAAARLPLPLPSSDQPATLEGALAYVSPEQTGRTSEPVDERSDLYSLGATLYEALAGEPPFTVTEPLELIHCHIARKPRPLCEAAAGVPEVVSDVVMRLLAKSPGDRYQSARGLEADLRDCLRQWRATGEVAGFALGQRDVPRELRILPRLYGRARELEALTACLERARWGAAELAIVSGSSGVGKSALVEALRPIIAKSGARLAACKFDQISRGVPYAPIAGAFRDQIRAILAEPAAALEAWKVRLHDALGENGKLIADLVPEVELLLGAQPPLEGLGAGPSQNRFAVVFQAFLRLFCEPGQPLVLFLDDLQWADLASLKLIELSLTGEAAKNILVIGCCRSNDPGASRLLDIVVEQLRKSRVAVSSIELPPLSTAHVAELLADTLRRSAEEVAPLAALVHDKTEGNPFFLFQFLKSLHEGGLLVADPISGVYDWDLERAREAMATSNVVELLAARIQGLDEDTQRALRLSACIGHSFRLPALATIAERSLEGTRAALRPAIAEGLIVASARQPDSYRFSHDRVQQTAYLLIDEHERQAVHLRIGRLMQSGAAAGGAPEEQMFEIAEHLNRGAQLITDPDERRGLARLNLEAGNRARNATAYDSAERCFAAGVTALPAGSWDDQHELAFDLHLAHAECEWLLGHHESAHAILDELDAHATSRLHRVRSRCVRVTVLEAELRIDDAVKASLDVLPLFGIELPPIGTSWARAVDDALVEVQRLLAGRRPEELADLPLLVDPEIQTLQKLVMIAAPLTYPFGADVFRVLNLLQMKLVLSHGLSDLSAYAFVLYGIVLAERRGLYDEAHAFGMFALSLCERFYNAQIACKVNQGFGSFLVHHHRPLHESLPYLDRACALGLSSGELTHMAYTTVGIGINRMGHGDELATLLTEVERYIGLTERAKNTLSRTVAEALRRAIRCLLGKTLSRDTWSQDGFDEAAFVGSLEERAVPMLLCWYYTLKQTIAIFDEEHDAALAFGNEAERYAGGMTGLYNTTDLVFYGCISRLSLRAGAPPEDRARLDAEIALRRAQMAIWATHCPANFRHKLILIEAEQARASGRADAVRLYLQASRAAHEQRFPHHEALALERLATLYLEQEDQASAHHHMQSAREAYVRWGARVKVARLDARYPGLAEGWDEGMAPVNAWRRRALTLPGLSSAGVDAAAVLKAIRGLSEELVLDRLLVRAVQVLIENAGAERGTLLLARGDDLVLMARGAVYPAEHSGLPALPLEDHTAEVCAPALRLAVRMRREMVSPNALHDPGLMDDPCVRSRAIKSLLIVPLLQKGRVLGAIHLENNLLENLFGAARVELVHLLAGQAAVAIDNALVYEDAERLVEDRTRELRKAQQELIHAARRAGMAEIATSTIHNVGNALTSLGVLRSQVRERLRQAGVAKVAQAAALLREHDRDLAQFLTQDHRGELFIEYLNELGRHLKIELAAACGELEEMGDHLGRIQNIVADQLRHAGTQLVSEQVDVAEVAEQALMIGVSSVERNRHGIEVTCEASGPVQICTDRHRLQQILLNLVTNARRSVCLVEGRERRITVRCSPSPDGGCRIQVEDNGSGIAPEHLERLFQQGFTTWAEGTGLGLHASILDARALGAELRAQSPGPDQGATFTLDLPKTAERA